MPLHLLEGCDTALQELIAALTKVDNPWVYALLLVSAYVENVFPPFPGDAVIIFGAFLVGMGRLQFSTVFIVITAGSLLGCMTIYYVGLVWGKKFFLGKNNRLFSKDKMLKVEGWFAKYGSYALLANRFLSGARSAISLFAGIASIRPAKVVLLLGISCCLWNTLLIYLGTQVVYNWRKLVDVVGKYDKIVFAVIVILTMTVFICRKFVLNKR